MNSIIEALRYSNHFKFPLTVDEIHKFMNIPIELSELREFLSENQSYIKRISSKNNFYFLNGQGENVNIRLNRRRHSKNIWNLVKMKLTILQKIPFIEFVAITGSLSVLNSDTNSDIDFFVVTLPDRVWITRLILYIVEKYIERSAPRNTHLCFNFINSTSKIKSVHENIYVAREIIQMKLLLGDRTYNQYMKNNKWLNKYLPNINLNNYSNRIKKKKLVKQNVSIMGRTIGKIKIRLSQSNNGIVGKIINMLDYLEYRRASRKLYNSFKFTPETNISKDEYKAHFSNHQKRIIKLTN